MSIIDRLSAQNQANPAQMLQQLRQNPAATLQSAGLNIPAGLTDPQQIVQHLIQSGQMPQNKVTQALQMMQRLRSAR